MSTTLVTSYKNPDLDGVASAIAYAEFLQHLGLAASAGILGRPHVEASYVLGRFKIPLPRIIEDADEFTEVRLVDASDNGAFGGCIPIDKVTEVIDHRQVNNPNHFPKATFQLDLVGSAATLIAEKFMRANLGISSGAATLLYAAIISNTLNLKSSVTTFRDQQAASWLNQVAKLPNNFWQELFAAKSDLSGYKLTDTMLGDFKIFTFNGKTVGITQLEILAADKLLEQRAHEVVQALATMMSNHKLDFMFLNLIDLVADRNYFVTSDPETQILLAKVLKLIFSNNIAERPGMILRKQIAPLIQAELLLAEVG